MNKFTEDEIRLKFEQNYLMNHKHAKSRNEHGEYVNAYSQDAWAGFKAAFELMNKPGFGYVAVKIIDKDSIKFYIVKEDYFKQYGLIKQYGLMQHKYTDQKFTDFIEIEPHVLKYIGGNLGYGTCELLELGFKLIMEENETLDKQQLV